MGKAEQDVRIAVLQNSSWALVTRRHALDSADLVIDVPKIQDSTHD